MSNIHDNDRSASQEEGREEKQQDWKERFNDESAASHNLNADAPSAEEAARAAEKVDNACCGDAPCMPKPTFSTFVLSLASSALVQLGEVPDPTTGEHYEDFALAKHSIDILSMLQEKIQNGLDQEETRLLEGLLYELRMKFIMKK